MSGEQELSAATQALEISESSPRLNEDNESISAESSAQSPDLVPPTIYLVIEKDSDGTIRYKISKSKIIQCKLHLEDAAFEIPEESNPTEFIKKKAESTLKDIGKESNSNGWFIAEEGKTEKELMKMFKDKLPEKKKVLFIWLKMRMMSQVEYVTIKLADQVRNNLVGVFQNLTSQGIKIPVHL